MNRTGPPLQTLLRRLAETPTDFVAGPAGMADAEVTAALVNDLVADRGWPLDATTLRRFRVRVGMGEDNRLALVRIVAWLLAEEWFRQAPLAAGAVLAVLDQAVAELASETKAAKFVEAPDRREELARLVLARLDYRPAGETIAQATDRLSAISSRERRRLIEASRESERRARAIREALVRKRAEESADKWTRE